MKMFALIDKVERAGMGIPQAVDSWQSILRVTPHYQVTYNPERTTVRLEIETLDDPKNDPKDDPKNVLYENIDIHVNSIALESFDDPKDDPKDVHKGNFDSTSLTKRQEDILTLLKEDGSITMEGLAQKLSVSMKTIKRDMSSLQKMNKIKRVGSRTKGEWKVLE